MMYETSPVGILPTPNLLLRAVEDKDTLIRCWGQKVKDQGRDETRCGGRSTLWIL